MSQINQQVLKRSPSVSSINVQNQECKSSQESKKKMSCTKCKKILRFQQTLLLSIKMDQIISFRKLNPLQSE